MSEVTDKNFGLLIAYLLPGFTLIVAMSERIPAIGAWLGSNPADAPTVGGFLYVTLASVAAGMTLNAARWLVLDTVHHRTGLHPPAWNFSMLQRNLRAFQGAVEHHYRHYQFFGAMTITALLASVFPSGLAGLLRLPTAIVATTMLLLTILFFVASRDALKKYYSRTGLILGIRETTERSRHHDKRMA